jgi:uncharacterized protein DUF6766
VRRVRHFLRDNGLTLFFATIFLLALLGQALTGHAEHNNQLMTDGASSISLLRYLTSSEFAVDVAENWQSEYLQFTLYILVTVWLVQRGSSESKSPDKIGFESDEDQKVGQFAGKDSPAWARTHGMRLRLYSHSLVAVMAAVFALSWLAQSIAGRAAYNHESARQQQPTLSWAQYVWSSDFWNRTFQNWQSEFLAVASMAAFAIYLRERGSPESKPVGTPHAAAGSDS